jgi:uncharacterized protein (DUF697 family)
MHDELPPSTDPDRERDAEAVIRNHMFLSMAGGAIPVPVLDLAAVTVVQLDMLKGLARVYQVPFDAKSARAFVTTLTSTIAGKLAARAGASAVKIIPGVGTIVGGAAQVVVTGASTYAVGNVFRRMFREGEWVDGISVDSIKDEARKYYDKGLEMARSLKDTLKGLPGRSG